MPASSPQPDDSYDVLPLAYLGHPALKAQSRPVNAITPEIRDLAGRMIATMRAHDGIGLAAPQIGVNLNLIVLEIPPPDDDDDEDDSESTSSDLGTPAPRLPRVLTPGESLLLPRMPMALVNPILTDFSTDLSRYVEGCLSIPKLTAPVWRPEFVTLHAQQLTGEPIVIRCGGLLSRCLQHEVDHLNGRLFIELISPEDLARMEPRLRKMEAETQAQLRKKRR